MSKNSARSSPRIHIVDRQDYWRNFAVEILRRADFNITASASYEVLMEAEPGDLLVLGCDDIGEPEMRFIDQARRKRYQVIVAAMEGDRFQTARRGFLSGALDVVVKPLGQNSLLKRMNESLFYADRNAALYA